MILTVVDDGNHYSSPYSSYQVPTLRSRSTESTPGAQRDNGLQIKVLPTPPHNKSSSDIPMAMGGSLSSQDEVVEAIKVDLQAQEMGTVKKYRYIRVDQFNKLYNFLLQNRPKYYFRQVRVAFSHLTDFRFDFDAELQTLHVYMSSSSHNTGVNRIYHAFIDAMKAQEKECGELDWEISTTFRSRIQDVDGSIRSKTIYVCDITIHNKYQEPVFSFEFAFSQSRDDAVSKIQKMLTRNPTVLAAVVISLDEDPKYGSPKRARSKGDLVDRGLWDQAVDRAPAFGPIHFGDHCWMGSVTSSFDIGFQNEVGLRIENSDIIPKSPNSDANASAALTELWRKLVKTFAGEDAVPVELGVDWDSFRAGIDKSLGGTAFGRIVSWVGSFEEPKRMAHTELRAGGSKRARYV